MMDNSIAIFIAGFLLGVISCWVLIRYGFNLGSKQLYQQKENLPPKGVDMPYMEQSSTAEAEDIEE